MQDLRGQTPVAPERVESQTMHALAKIVARHAGRHHVEPGEIVNVTPDYVMLTDRGAVRAAAKFREFGGEKVMHPGKVVVVFDHHFPAIRVRDAEAQRGVRDWIKAQEIPHFYPGQGICHLVLPEKGFAFPGSMIFGTDSHTTTNSAVGGFSSGMGHSDVGSFLATGHFWLRMPEVLRFVLHGTLNPSVSAKDIILHILGTYGEDAASYMGVEFCGPTVDAMSMDERFVLCNMVIDFGGKTGYIQPDETTFQFLKHRCPKSRWDIQTTDSDNDCARIIDIDVSKIEPLVAVPHNLTTVKPAEELGDVRIDEAVLGTCTGGRITDFRIAAELLRGRRIAPDVRLMINPGSQEVFKQAMAEGLIEVLVDAGASIGVTGCGPCSGCHQGMLAPAENTITTSSRNFQGRMGSPDAGIYVASPATVAAAALTGRIVNPNTLKRKEELTNAG